MHVEFAVLQGRGLQGKTFGCSVSKHGILKGTKL